jgi:glutathione S-transferase
LLPSDPFAAAKVRELVTFLDLHLELVARNLYPEALFGGKVSDEVKEKTKAQLDKNLRAFAKLARFDPYLAGDTFGLADCAAIVHFPLISAATKVIYGQDLFADLPVRDYLKRMAERPYIARVQAERKANAELMMARIKAKSAAS